MDRDYVIFTVSEKIKLVRTEQNYTQDKMAEILGISKKTLVQIEKGRISIGWTTAVATCALFRDSSILQHAFGGDPLDVVELAARDEMIRPAEKTLGGYVWWRNLEEWKGHRLQQNLISHHYRILDDENFRLFSSFDYAVIQEKWRSVKSIR